MYNACIRLVWKVPVWYVVNHLGVVCKTYVYKVRKYLHCICKVYSVVIEDCHVLSYPSMISYT